MIKNQRGGIISKIFIIPAGVVLMAGVFFLGYWVGKYQGRSGISGEVMQPLPEITSSTGTKQEEFTFYKTLTDKTDKTVSIDLKPKAANEEIKPEKKQTTAEVPKTVPAPSAPKEKRVELNIEKETSSPVQPKREASKQPQPPAKKEPATAASVRKLHYTLQTASYPNKDLADDEVKRLKKRGYAAFVASTELPGKGMWHRVRLGSFSNRAAAEKLHKTLRAKEGIASIITIE